MLLLTTSELQAIAIAKCESFRVPPNVTVTVDDQRTLVFDHPDCAVTIANIPELVDEEQLHLYLDTALFHLARKVTEYAAKDHWNHRPWWVTVCAMVPGLHWIGMLWVQHSSAKIARSLTR